MGRYENYNCKHDNWFGTYSPLYINTLHNCVVKSKYTRKDYDLYYGNNIIYNNIEFFGGTKVKNREKFREEIVKNAREIDEEEDAGVSACEFINRNVLPTFGDGASCFTINCAWCRFLLGIWLDEEYEEPPKPEVDWDNVPVDTMVRVRDREDQEWTLMYFKGIDDGNAMFRYSVWAFGATSKTANNSYTLYKYCELVEDEDDGK